MHHYMYIAPNVITIISYASPTKIYITWDCASFSYLYKHFHYQRNQANICTRKKVHLMHFYIQLPHHSCLVLLSRNLHGKDHF